MPKQWKDFIYACLIIISFMLVGHSSPAKKTRAKSKWVAHSNKYQSVKVVLLSQIDACLTTLHSRNQTGCRYILSIEVVRQEWSAFNKSVFYWICRHKLRSSLQHNGLIVAILELFVSAQTSQKQVVPPPSTWNSKFWPINSPFEQSNWWINA